MAKENEMFSEEMFEEPRVLLNEPMVRRGWMKAYIDYVAYILNELGLEKDDKARVFAQNVWLDIQPDDATTIRKKLEEYKTWKEQQTA